MPPALSQIQQDVVETRLRHGTKHKHVVKEVGISLGQVRKMSSNLKSFGTVVAPKCRKRGKPRLLTAEMTEESFFVLIFDHL
jgi:transposase